MKLEVPLPLAAVLAVFVTLKLTDTIDWSWLWVLSPIWMPLATALLFFIAYMLLKERG